MPPPKEIAFLHEASQRGDALLERYFGKTNVQIDGKEIPVHQGIMPKGDEGLEIADFIMHAAGGQERWKLDGRKGFRRDFKAVFHGNHLWASRLSVDSVVSND